jgi:cytochrome c oxidase subunit 3
MTVTLLFFLIIVMIALWWLLHQQLHAKPWLEEGVNSTGSGTLSFPASKVGLWVLMTVISSLFALLIGAYLMRMGFADWRSLQIPKLLWLNTGALILCSVFLQGAQASIHRASMGAVRTSLLIGGAFGIAFVAGQLRAWNELRTAGEVISLNPSNSFFYLLTGLHGLHVLGGLIALGITADRVWRSLVASQVSLSVELCATYWHFLLVVWLILFGLLTGGADDLGRICSQLIS